MSFDLLLHEVDKFRSFVSSSGLDVDNLLKVRDEFHERLSKSFVLPEKIRKDNPLAEGAFEVQRKIEHLIYENTRSWDDSQPMRELSEKFQDKIVLLVFGKVNAGKSTFCNFIASQFPEEQRRYFRVEGGKIVKAEAGFKEGVTETTSDIQGVELGGNLILLDSPGLHSVTEENGAITRRYIDAADAVLWLTPSSSPGQVAELNDLREELKHSKPLLPVITASDNRVEDEVDGEIVSFYVNKPDSDRRAQEDDVHKRTRQKLQEMEVSDQVDEPVSVSVFMYRKQDNSEIGLVNAGLCDLASRMTDLVSRGAEYKKGKVRQQVLNYLDKNVVTSVVSVLLPIVDDYERAVVKSKKSAEREVDACISDIKYELGILVPKWAEEHKESKNIEAVIDLINVKFMDIVQNSVSRVIIDFSDDVRTVYKAFSTDGIAPFESLEIEYERISGMGISGVISTAIPIASSALAGAMITTTTVSFASGFASGSMLGSPGGPPVALIAGIIGGILGSILGKEFIKKEKVKEVIGVDVSAFVSDVMDKVSVRANELVPQFFDLWFSSISSMELSVELIRTEIYQLQNDLKNIERDL